MLHAKNKMQNPIIVHVYDTKTCQLLHVINNVTCKL